MARSISDPSCGQTWYTDGKTYTAEDVSIRKITSDMVTERILKKYYNQLAFCNIGELTDYFCDNEGWLYFSIGRDEFNHEKYCRFYLQIKEWNPMNKIDPQDIENLLKIVDKLEKTQGRPFTLDGHLLGSIGEVMAAYHYGIELYGPSHKTHDGEVDGKKVQIKITQKNRISIREKPDYLLVLYLNKKSKKFLEVYNGPGDKPWKNATGPDKRGYRYLGINKLIEMNEKIPTDEQIQTFNPIEVMKTEDKN